MSYDIKSIRNEITSLKATSDGLANTIVEATAEKTRVDDRVTELTNLLSYLEGGSTPTITKLATPATFGALVIDATSINLDWDPVTHATNYVLSRATLPDYSDETVIYEGSTTGFSDEDLQSNVTYFYKVYATGAGYGNSNTAAVYATTLYQLHPVDNLTLIPGDTVVGISFDPVDNALLYDIWKHTSNDLGGATKITSTYATSYSDDDVLNGTTYYYWVIATAPTYLDSEPVSDNVIPNSE